MTGLEKILKAIEEQAQANADAILAEANKKADEIISAANLEAEKKSAQIAEKSAIDVQSAISRAESAAALQEKKLLLQTKQQIISNIITKARDSLAVLPDSEYSEIIIQMVKRFAHNNTGKIVFPSTDKKRLPADFNDRLKLALVDKPAASLTISDEDANINGGFLLIYGDVEENCSFDALFSTAKESLQDKVNSLLFD